MDQEAIEREHGRRVAAASVLAVAVIAADAHGEIPRRRRQGLGQDGSTHLEIDRRIKQIGQMLDPVPMPTGADLQQAYIDAVMGVQGLDQRRRFLSVGGEHWSPIDVERPRPWPDQTVANLATSFGERNRIEKRRVELSVTISDVGPRRAPQVQAEGTGRQQRDQDDELSDHVQSFPGLRPDSAAIYSRSMIF